MTGLKTQENDKFNRFFSLVQTAAANRGCVFFAEAGDGNPFETPELEGEDMMGWLIPNEKIVNFEKLWQDDLVDDGWSDYFVWALWENINGKIKVRFSE